LELVQGGFKKTLTRWAAITERRFPIGLEPSQVIAFKPVTKPALRLLESALRSPQGGFKKTLTRWAAITERRFPIGLEPSRVVAFKPVTKPALRLLESALELVGIGWNWLDLVWWPQ
jgi:hypothetical protein